MRDTRKCVAGREAGGHLDRNMSMGDVGGKGLGDGLEVGVNKSRNPLSDRVMGRNNGVARVIGFVEIEGGGAGNGDMKDILYI